jgi:hypothetical protein
MLVPGLLDVAADMYSAKLLEKCWCMQICAYIIYDLLSSCVNVIGFPEVGMRKWRGGERVWFLYLFAHGI